MPYTLHQRTLGYYQNRCRIEFWSVFWEIQSAKWEILRYVATAGIERAEENFNKDKCFEKYINLYNTLLVD